MQSTPLTPPVRRHGSEVRGAVLLLAGLAVAACTSTPTARSSQVARPQGSIEVLSAGKGPMVLMVASLGRPASDFDDLSARLADAGYRTVRYNARGIGRSTGPMQDVSLADLAAEAAAAIEAHGGGPAIVIGHAFGQRVGRMLATDRPELVRSVIMLAAGGKAPMRPGVREALLDCFNPELSEEAHLRAVQAVFFAPGNDASVWRDGWYPATAAMQIAATQSVAVERWWGAGSAPMLVVQGLQDVIAPPDNGRALQQEFGDRVELVEIDGAGHALLPEQPARVAQAVLDYLAKH